MNTEVGQGGDDMTDTEQHVSDNPMSPADNTHQNSDPNGSPASEKKPVVRGARACTVCRNAKMRCIGGDDQDSFSKPCNRCRKSGVSCVFERHRRGRKPGSKLSDSSKLRRQSKDQTKREKAPAAGPSSSSQKAKPATTFPKLEEQSEYDDGAGSSVTTLPHHPDDQGSHHGNQNGPSPVGSAPLSAQAAASPHVHSGQYPPPMFAPEHYQSPPQPSPSVAPSARVETNPGTSHSRTPDDEDSRSDEAVYPSAILARERNRQSFMATVLNPSHDSGPGRHGQRTREAKKSLDTQIASWEPPVVQGLPKCFDPPKEHLPDPIELGLLTELEAVNMLSKVLECLNPFVNLFDSNLHTVAFIRPRSSFLFTVLMMAGCKFFKPELFRRLQRMSYVFASRALDEQWKGIEVVQAFCCMVYWKEPEDNRTWAYIGYACRMAIELGLNTYTHHPPRGETELTWRQRRNRERTYLVLFVHDRSLSMQTGRIWMLPEDELIRTSSTWHQHVYAGGQLRPEDVVVAAFVQLRLLSAETNSVLHLRRQSNRENSDVNYEMLLNGCNRKLTDWVDYWEIEMTRAGGSDFHMCLLRFFRLHVRLFLNSLGMAAGETSFSLQALLFCCTSAQETLEIVGELSRLNVLRFGQDVIAVMSAYAAIFLLKLLRRTEQKTLDAESTHRLIRQTAAAFYNSGENDSPSKSARAHAHFLRSLVDDEGLRTRASESHLGSDEAAAGGSRAPKPDPAIVPSLQPGHRQPPPMQQQQQQQQQQHLTNGYAQQYAERMSNGRPDGLSITTAVPPRPPPVMSSGMTVDGGHGGMYYSPQSAPPGRHPPPSVAGPSHYGPGMATNGHHGRSASISSGYGPPPPPPVMTLQQAQMQQYHQPQQQQQQQQQQQHHHQSPSTMYQPGPMGMQTFGPETQYVAEQQAQMMIPSDPQVDPQMYTRHMFEQLGMREGPMQPGNPYADQFAVMSDPQMFNH